MILNTLLLSLSIFLVPNATAFTIPKTVVNSPGSSKFPSVCSNEAQLTKILSFQSDNLSLGRYGMGSSKSQLRSSLHCDETFVLSAVLLLSTFGITLERRTKIGKALSAPLATMALSLTIANLGFIPFSSPVYNFTNKYLVSLAVPLLLFDSDLRRVITDTGSLLIAFFVGSISTIIGTLVAYPLIPLKALGNDGWRVASALAARHIGGAINFVAVSETLRVEGSAISAAIAADNVVVALYFGLLFYLAKPGEGVGTVDAALFDNNAPLDPEDVNAVSTNDTISMSSLAISLTIASCLMTIGKILTKTMLPDGTSALPLISAATVIGATLFPRFFQELRSTGTAVGVIFMQMFFAASGAAGSIRLVMQSAPSLFLFSALQVAIHFLCLMGLGRIVFRLKANDLYLASNANVGGPTTAAAMAKAKSWESQVLPALLVGILGYASATPIALALGQILLKLPLR